MIYVFIIFQILIFIESYILYQKKMRKSSAILFLINTISLIVNIIFFLPLFKNEITTSSVIYFQKKMTTEAFQTLLWFLIDVILIAVNANGLRKASKKQKISKIITSISYLFSAVLFLFLSVVLFSKSADLLIFIYVIVAIIYLIRKYCILQKNYYLAVILILLIFTWYSYCTYTGAARFQIALTGYPNKAYDGGLEEQKFYQEENVKKYVPIETIEVIDGDMGIIEIRNYGFLKFGNYSTY